MHWLINSLRLMSTAVAFRSISAKVSVDMRMEMTSFSGFFGMNRSMMSSPLLQIVF